MPRDYSQGAVKGPECGVCPYVTFVGGKRPPHTCGYADGLPRATAAVSYTVGTRAEQGASRELVLEDKVLVTEPLQASIAATLAPDLCGFPAQSIFDPRSSGRLRAMGCEPSKLQALQAAVSAQADDGRVLAELEAEAAIRAPAGSVLGFW